MRLLLLLPSVAYAHQPMATPTSLLNLLVYLLIVGVVLSVIWWLISYLELPQPFQKVARVIVALVGVIILVYLLLGLL